MQAQRTVVLYVDNRLDNTLEVDPVELAQQFATALDDGHFEDVPVRASLELAYRYWIAGPKGCSASWDEADWESLVDGLQAYLSDKPELRERLWDLVCP